MSLIANTIHHKKSIVAYLTAGDGGIEQTLQAASTLINEGVDVLELGMPHSDPIADGPVITASHQRALQHIHSLPQLLDVVKQIKQQHSTPIVVFTYYNPLYQQGRSIYKKMKDAGVDGILVVDCPLDASPEHHQACIDAGIDPIALISLNTPKKRIKKLAQLSRGMIYAIGQIGTTGMRTQNDTSVSNMIRDIRAVSDTPVVCGFGISSKEQAEEMMQAADGIVIGSFFVNCFTSENPISSLTNKLNSIDPRRPS